MKSKTPLSNLKTLMYIAYTTIGKNFLPTSVYTRPMTRVVYQTAKTDLIGVEIGVENGFNAKTILKTLPIKKIYLIDLKFVKTTLKRLAKYNDKIQFIEKYSEEAVNEISDTIDFVYIDGSHEYEYVKKDIELYYPTVKQGGIIGGHDFDANHMDVCRAVFEFVQKHDLKVNGSDKDWWIIKK